MPELSLAPARIERADSTNQTTVVSKHTMPALNAGSKGDDTTVDGISTQSENGDIDRPSAVEMSAAKNGDLVDDLPASRMPADWSGCRGVDKKPSSAGVCSARGKSPRSGQPPSLLLHPIPLICDSRQGLPTHCDANTCPMHSVKDLHCGKIETRTTRPADCEFSGISFFPAIGRAVISGR